MDCAQPRVQLECVGRAPMTYVVESFCWWLYAVAVPGWCWPPLEARVWLWLDRVARPRHHLVGWVRSASRRSLCICSIVTWLKQLDKRSRLCFKGLLHAQMISQLSWYCLCRKTPTERKLMKRGEFRCCFEGIASCTPAAPFGVQNDMGKVGRPEWLLKISRRTTNLFIYIESRSSLSI